MRKVGDRVKLTSIVHGISDSNPYFLKYKILGTVYKVLGLEWTCPFKVKWDNGIKNGYNSWDLEDSEYIIGLDELFEL